MSEKPVPTTAPASQPEPQRDPQLAEPEQRVEQPPKPSREALRRIIARMQQG